MNDRFETLARYAGRLQAASLPQLLNVDWLTIAPDKARPEHVDVGVVAEERVKGDEEGPMGDHSEGVAHGDVDRGWGDGPWARA